METKKLIKLDSKVYEHPVDRAMLKYLSSLPGFETLTNWMLDWTYVKWHLVDLKGSNFQVTEKSCPELYNQVKNVADILGVENMPHIYTEWGYFINAYTTGIKENTLLTIYSGAVDLLSKEQLDYIIGHEMGHIKSKHVVYQVMAQMLTNVVQDWPIASSLITPIRIGLLYWNRMSEFTSDRAGLLACQNPDAAIDTVIKMSGVPQKYFNTTDRKVFMEQAKEFEYLMSGTETLMRNLSSLDNSHPWTVLRAAELIKWIESGEYENILNTYGAVKCKHCSNLVLPNDDICHVCGMNPFK